MLVSVRLDPQTERQLAQLARATGKSKSELIRDAIREMGDRVGGAITNATVYDRIADLIGIVDRGPGNRAARSEEVLRALFAGRRRRRR